jgi:uncharacterized repeat protein (TIGR01451 family)
MNSLFIYLLSMKNFYRTTANLLLTFALLVTTFGVPAMVSANGDGSGSTFTTASSINTIVSYSESSSKCKLSANVREVVTGGRVTLSWETAGFKKLTLNGEPIYRMVGSRTINNIQTDTTFVLEGVGEDNNHCRAEVRVSCVPPPPVGECVLEVNKSVNKTTARPGEELTYTIKVKNSGTANCTGGGVKILDVVDPNLTYLHHTLTNNLTAGYGTNPVYNQNNRTLFFNGNTLEPGEEGTITWVGKINTPNTCGDFTVRNQAKATAKELDKFQTWVHSENITTEVDNECVVDVCDKENVHAKLLSNEDDYFTVRFTNDNDCEFAVGATSYRVPVDDGKLCSWENRKLDCQVRYAFKDIKLAPHSSQEIKVAKPNKCYQIDWYYGISVEVLDYAHFGNPALSYVINAVTGEDRLYGAIIDATLEECRTPEPHAPSCDLFTATPSEVEAGKPVTLRWKASNATALYISNGIGRVDNLYGFDGSMTYSPVADTNFVMTVVGANNKEVTCSAPVTIKRDEPKPFTCANNVTFTASDYSITRGDSTRLEWSVTRADTVSINTIGSVGLTGNKLVSPTSDTTYTLTAKKGTETINCPISIDVSTGGGGGGSVSPRCELEISKTKVKAGESVTLKWKTRNATEITLSDDRREVLLTTEDYLAKDKKRYLSDSITVKPTRDTKYTLVAERGSREDECSVQVKIEKDEVVVLETRDQEPLVAGIALTQVPYTGFEAGPALTFMFYVLLVAWALYITYLIVVRRRTLSPENFSQTTTPSPTITGAMAMRQAESIRPDVFTASTMVANKPPTVPTNLPVGDPVIGYDNYTEIVPAQTNPHQVDDAVVTDIENRAHSQKALLSSDAIRHFIATTTGDVKRNEVLDEVISDAKKTYPLEDGWIVINEMRMRNLCKVCQQSTASDKAPFVPATIPEGSGSLAEAIVTGNVVAAYEMIGHRPMFALADASADLDSVYRQRKGETQIISDLLLKETARLSDEQLKEAITALTSAIDGTYNDEASAVKMAIMKAVKAVA